MNTKNGLKSKYDKITRTKVIFEEPKVEEKIVIAEPKVDEEIAIEEPKIEIINKNMSDIGETTYFEKINFTKLTYTNIPAK